MKVDESRTLIMLRHAKTERDHIQGDWHRRLTARGRRDANFAAEAILGAIESPVELILSSDAVRATETAEIVKLAIADDVSLISSNSIYLASASDLMNEIHSLDDRNRTVIMVGHNPGFLELTNMFAGHRGGYDHLPTSGFTIVSGAWATWSDAGLAGATVSPIISPRNQSNEF